MPALILVLGKPPVDKRKLRYRSFPFFPVPAPSDSKRDENPTRLQSLVRIVRDVCKHYPNCTNWYVRCH